MFTARSDCIATPHLSDRVSVEFRDGKMGYAEDVSLGLPSSSSKPK
ncbi:hypothetical protein QM306_14725 [Burkholderia cenocepacia]|nr:hypothetical protein [Burkholderia cenocepacia]